jgi:hypothetical protein
MERDLATAEGVVAIGRDRFQLRQVLVVLLEVLDLAEHIA